MTAQPLQGLVIRHKQPNMSLCIILYNSLIHLVQLNFESFSYAIAGANRKSACSARESLQHVLL